MREKKTVYKIMPGYAKFNLSTSQSWPINSAPEVGHVGKKMRNSNEKIIYEGHKSEFKSKKIYRSS